MLGLYYNEREYQVEGEVQIIGTNTWRSIEKVPPCAGCPISFKGRCHWLHRSEALINTFDADKEVFKVIQMSRGLKKLLWAALGLLDGNLCLTTGNDEWAVWVMNKYGIQDSWTKTFVVLSVRNMKNSISPGRTLGGVLTFGFAKKFSRTWDVMFY
ncbi:hypothetical protein POM88_052777 [Heracleum sosnowskyi]|uniref:F-box associated beta-propeller type 1 domain-containing protein n=1 Tax=Heracleum sosnowskyi TaxID=360622 RepID=A0AAD8LYK5_9APIA|nr:hypothetical protein POM88_052777 [Heracleum sosnowskyi]